MKRLRVFVQDSPAGRIRGRDEILSADPIPKLMLMPMTWQGELAPALDDYLEKLKPLETGFALEHVLHAEEVPALLDMGTRWLGNFQTKLLAASADFASADRPEEAGAIPGTDVAEVVAQLDRLRRDLGTADRGKIGDGVRRLRDAARRASDEAQRHGAVSEGRRIADGLMPRRTVGELSRPVSITTINQRNREAAVRTAPPTIDNSGRMRWRPDAARRTTDSRETAVRDTQHAVRTATTQSGLLSAMNAANRAFHARTGDLVPAAPSRAPASTPAEVNRRNRAFWAAR